MNTSAILFDQAYFLNNIPSSALFCFIMLLAIPLPLSAITPLFYSLAFMLSYYISYLFPSSSIQAMLQQASILDITVLLLMAYLIGYLLSLPLRLLSLLSYSPSTHITYSLLPLCFQATLCLSLCTLDLSQSMPNSITHIIYFQSNPEGQLALVQLLKTIIPTILQTVPRLLLHLIIYMLPFYLLATFKALLTLFIPKNHPLLFNIPPIEALIELTLMLYLFPIFIYQMNHNVF